MSDRDQNSHLALGDVLHGQRVHLRCPRVDELSFIRTLWGDPETMAAVGGVADFPEPKARDWFARMVDPGQAANCYCLIFNQEDVPVGEISFHQWVPEARSAELNVKVLAVHRGRGYGKDALRTFLGFFFDRIGGRVMTDDVAVDNQAAQCLLSSLGFEEAEGASDACMMVMTQEKYVNRYGGRL